MKSYYNTYTADKSREPSFSHEVHVGLAVGGVNCSSNEIFLAPGSQELGRNTWGSLGVDARYVAIKVRPTDHESLLHFQQTAR